MQRSVSAHTAFVYDTVRAYSGDGTVQCEGGRTSEAGAFIDRVCYPLAATGARLEANREGV